MLVLLKDLQKNLSAKDVEKAAQRNCIKNPDIDPRPGEVIVMFRVISDDLEIIACHSDANMSNVLRNLGFRWFYAEDIVELETPE